MQRWRDRQLLCGLCVQCWRPARSKTLCAYHLSVSRERGRIEKVRLARQLSRSCYKRSAKGKVARMRDYQVWKSKQNEASREKRRAVIRKYKHKLKAEAMQQYGNGVCNRCGISDLRVLTLDHLGGTDSPHRVKDYYIGGAILYAKLKRLGWPRKFQVLCINCHFIVESERRSAGRYCQHCGSSWDSTSRLVGCCPRGALEVLGGDSGGPNIGEGKSPALPISGTRE